MQVADTGLEGDWRQWGGWCAPTIAAFLRVCYACLCMGSAFNRQRCRAVLRQPDNLRLLVRICAGPAGCPLWRQFNIGTKFMAVAAEILRLPDGARWEEMHSLPLYAIICGVVEQLAHILVLRLRKHRHLDEADQALAAGVAQVMLLLPPLCPSITWVLSVRSLACYCLLSAAASASYLLPCPRS